MEWRNEGDTNVTYDYSGHHYEYVDEDDYYFVSQKEVDCKQQISDWEKDKIQGEIERTCPPFWDRISCWPPVAAGVTASVPCPEYFNGVAYDPSDSAFLDCMEPEFSNTLTEAWPLWANKSNYGNCVPRANIAEETGRSSDHYKVQQNIYLFGYSISLVALLVATSIFIYFKEMRCLRNKIHSNLFLTFILTNTCWIITAVMQSYHNSNSSLEVSWCVSLVFSRYFHMATFFWMFVEGKGEAILSDFKTIFLGLFLFVQVIATFAVEDSRMKFRHYFLIGWGLPLIVVCIWAVFTQSKVLEERQKMLQTHNGTQPLHTCPFMESTNHEWIYNGPIFLLLATNAFFLVSIFYVVVTKLRSSSSGQREASDHQKLRAAKALLVIIPLLGINYLITIVGPSDPTSVFYFIFVHFRAILLSSQGLLVTLPYCFFNTEVKGILAHHWNRWRNTRYVEHNYSRGHSARNSISMAGYYACDSNSTALTGSRRNSFLRLHSLYLSGSQQSGHAHNRTSHQQESHIVTSVLLERCGDNALRHSNRIIPVIQEETRTPSPSNQLSPTIISVTPATPSPSHHGFQHTDTSGPSLLTHVSPHTLDTGSISPDQLSTQSSPINRCSTREFIQDKQTSSLLDLDTPGESFNQKCLSSCTLPGQHVSTSNSKMPDILNFPAPIPGTFSYSCPSVNNHKEKR